jgi:hypothetical protein
MQDQHKKSIVFLYANNEYEEIKIKNITSFAIAPKKGNTCIYT